MKTLDKYKKPKTIETKKITSINLEPRHIEFVQKNDLNLSAIVRDLIDSLIKNQK